MLVFTSLQSQVFVRPASFPGIYLEDQYLDGAAQRAAHDYALAHARVEAIERQRELYCHRLGSHHQFRGPGHFPRRHYGRPSTDFRQGFGSSPATRPTFQPRRAPSYSLEELELAYSVWQQEERILSQQREAAAREREEVLARQREAQRQRALAEAAAREEQVRAARVARIRAQQARDQEVLHALLSQLGLAFVQAQSAQDTPRANRQQPTVSTARPAAAAASAPSPSPAPVDRKGKGKAVDVPASVPTPISTKLAHAPEHTEVPTLKEELEARIRTESDPEVQQSLVLLYSDLFDIREPSQSVAGPSGTNHASFQIPASGPSTPSIPAPATSPVSAAPKPVEIKSTTTAAATTSQPEPVTATGREKDETRETETEGAPLHRTPALPPAIAAKLLKFYNARRARKLSLAEIKEVEDALRKLETTFEFPAQLDFVSDPLPSPSALGYTTNNAPVHAYEHALNQLLTRLDGVESNGDDEVRGRRREVVKEVERALEAMERRVEESRGRSRERDPRRRASVSSQASDGEATVTPYNLHTTDNVDKAETEEVVKAPAEVEETRTVAPVEVNTALGSTDQVEAPEQGPSPAEAQPAAASSPLINATTDDGVPRITAGVPDSGADIDALTDDEFIHADPSSPADEIDFADGTIDQLESAKPQSSPATAEAATAPSRASDAELSPVSTAPEDSPHTQFEVAEEDVAAPASEYAEDTNATAPLPAPAVAAPEAISRVASSATDETFFTADTDSEAIPLSATDDGTFFTASTATPVEPASLPMSRSASSSSAGQDTFLLSSTPLADDQPKEHRPSGGDDEELEIISTDELEAARNDSDWSDIESHSDL
ncbi:hypothetical protein BD310DRAFT_976159 [Dichomitus squalens]|uniref:BAG domain-containing protein n=1 Tax=Dichomitus squalens TaxID=114155 RepID=A0A4Q9PZF9_9APHY|nr:hypothetical protein BD310DRAFT_976159 [Dichomitus squalens]